MAPLRKTRWSQKLFELNCEIRYINLLGGKVVSVAPVLPKCPSAVTSPCWNVHDAKKYPAEMFLCQNYPRAEMSPIRKVPKMNCPSKVINLGSDTFGNPITK